MWIALAAATAQGQELTLEVTGLRPGGTVRAGVYASPDGWLEDDRAVASCEAVVKDGTATCAIPVPGPGRYAVAFFHDVDDDGTFDRTALGIPREGFGFSRDAAAGVTGPKFTDAALAVGQSVVSVLARVRYAF